ncbi:MAG: hypothetical protein AAFO94_03285, partial [Bacteroidota bacterium]
MIPSLRTQYNQKFSEATYNAFLDTITAANNHRPKFKIAETPVFIPDELKFHLTQACEEISDVICQENFKDLTKGALLPENLVPNETKHTAFLQMDFGICRDANGQLTPQLIEIQGFPTLYFYQDMKAQAYRKHFNIPDHMSHLLGGIDSAQYHEMLRNIIVGSSQPENVVLLEVQPFEQTTLVDFLATRKAIGTPIKCVSELKVEGRDVYYIDDNGRKVGVEKIYNRVIFDELIHKTDLPREFYFTKETNVRYVGHPHWFFRISKYTLPFLKSKYVPDTYFL